MQDDFSRTGFADQQDWFHTFEIPGLQIANPDAIAAIAGVSSRPALTITTSDQQRSHRTSPMTHRFCSAM
jgi:hypothetical protein